MKTVYQAKDGAIFTTSKDCLTHEAALEKAIKDLEDANIIAFYIADYGTDVYTPAFHSDLGADEIWSISQKLVSEFMQSAEYLDMNMSLYTAVQEFVDNRINLLSNIEALKKGGYLC